MLRLDASLLARIADLELVARMVVDGARLGAHRSAGTGSGAEFQHTRPYLPGDDLKYLDWKHYGRTDRLFMRVHRATTEWPVMLALDTSASMRFADASGVTKLQSAVMVAAALGYLLLQQGEAVGLIGHREVPASALPARTGRAHLVRLLATLQQMEASGRTDLSGAARHAAQRLGRRGLIVLFSDLYGEDGWHAALREVRRMGHEVAVLHVLAPEERTLSLRGEVELVDMESGERLVMAAARVKADYEARLSAFVNDQRAFARAEGITYVDASTTRGPDEVLRALVRLRLQGDGSAR